MHLKNMMFGKTLKQYQYGPSIYQQSQLNIQGGGQNNRYYISGGYDKNLETVVANKYDRLTLNANNTYSLFKDKLETTVGINFTSSNTNSNSEGEYLPSTPYDRFADDKGNSLPVASSNTLRQSYVDTAGNGKLLDWNYRPKDELKSNAFGKQEQYKINLGIDYRILKELSIAAKYQYLKENNDKTTNHDVNSYFTRNIVNRYSSIVNNEVINEIPLGDILTTGRTDFTSKIVRLQLNYKKIFVNDHELNAITGYEGSDNRINSMGITQYGFDPATKNNENNRISPLKSYFSYYEPGSSSRIKTAPNVSENINITQSYYANISYSYKQKYIVSGSARKDESNIFGVETNQKGVPLWSTGLAWLVDKEHFYNTKWLNSLKLRATYGFNGNVDKTVSGYLTVLSSGLNNEWGDPYTTISNPPNPLLRWEKVETWNLGLDFSADNNRISGSIDIYQKNGIDLIGNNPISMQSGVTQFRGNGASLRSKGLDLVIYSRNLKVNGKLQWTTSLLFNYNTDKVTSYKIKQPSNSNLVTNNFINPLEGYPYYALFSYQSAGLDVTGSPQGYLNGIISKDYAKIASIFDPDQLKFHGTSIPKYFGSLTNTFNYKNFELSFNIVFKFDYYFRKTNAFVGFTSSSRITDYEKRWQSPGDELKTKIPAFDYAASSARATFFRNSQDLVEKGDHIRFQDVRASYNFSRKPGSKSILNGANIFLYTKNLGVLWKKTHYDIDPDYGTTTIPAPFSCSLGINVNF